MVSGKVTDASDHYTADAQSNAPAAMIPSKAGMRQVQAKLMLDIMSIDPIRAHNLIDCWKSWKEQMKGESGKQHLEFSTVAQYLPQRRIDVGQKYGSKQRPTESCGPC